jgi:hypothetical protein
LLCSPGVYHHAELAYIFFFLLQVCLSSGSTSTR